MKNHLRKKRKIQILIKSSTQTIHEEPPVKRMKTEQDLQELKQAKCLLTSITEAEEQNFGVEILAVHLLDESQNTLIDPRVKHILEEFRDIIASDESELGQAKGNVQHEINLEIEDPIALSPIKVPLLYKEQVEEEVDAMIKQRVIRPSKSSWGFNMVLVDKPNGRKRICVNYKKLNKVTNKDKFPKPNLHQILEELKGASVYSKIDLWSGFYQCPMRQKDIEKTAFYTPRGLFEFMV